MLTIHSMKTLLLLWFLLTPLTANAVSLDPADWNIRFSAGVSEHPRGPGWFFNFPGRTGHVNYVTTRYRGDRPLSGVLRMGIAIQTLSGAPRFNYFAGLQPTGCNTPATVRPYFEVNVSNDQFGRWWSNPVGIELQQGIFDITVPIEPENWSSVYGRFGNQGPAALNGFRRATRTVRQVGFTFGGGCFFGHGVRVLKGKARFLLMQYEIN